MNNVYISHRTDWLLKFVYRTASAQSSIAGVEPVLWDDRRMHNIDLTDTVSLVILVKTTFFVCCMCMIVILTLDVHSGFNKKNDNFNK